VERLDLPRPVARDPVIIGIDDQTRELPEPNTLWHEHFGKLFEALAAAQPAVVGIDIALPDRSYDAFLGRKLDRALASGLLALHRVAPVILGVTRDLSRVERRVHPLFVSVVGGRRALGQVVWAEDLMSRPLRKILYVEDEKDIQTIARPVLEMDAAAAGKGDDPCPESLWCIGELQVESLVTALGGQ